MICVDTTFLVDFWRNKGTPSHPVLGILEHHREETFAVPAHAAGEFLEGGANISGERLRESLQMLRLFEIGEVTLETALHYARIVSDLRQRSQLFGASKPDLWIAAWAVQNGASLATRNTRHFNQIQNLKVISY